MVSWNLMISINVLLYLVCWRIWSYGLELETSTILQTLIISDVKSHKIRHEFGWQSAECWSFDQILLPPGWNKSGDCRFAWQNETFRRLSSTWTIFNHSKSCVIRHLILRNHTKKKHVSDSLGTNMLSQRIDYPKPSDHKNWVTLLCHTATSPSKDPTKSPQWGTLLSQPRYPLTLGCKGYPKADSEGW